MPFAAISDGAGNWSRDAEEVESERLGSRRECGGYLAKPDAPDRCRIDVEQHAATRSRGTRVRELGETLRTLTARRARASKPGADRAHTRPGRPRDVAVAQVTRLADSDRFPLAKVCGVKLRGEHHKGGIEKRNGSTMIER
jgi:hypothetical protein